jgi:mannose-6-phosphate isomerase-like protein (cupin superfamily)
MSAATERLSTAPLSIITKPWGAEELLAHTPHYALKKIFVKKGSRSSLQYHRQKAETLHILSGRLQIDVGVTPETLAPVQLSPGETIDIPAGRIHRSTAVEDCWVIEVSTPHLDDVVRLEDDHGRGAVCTS